MSPDDSSSDGCAAVKLLSEDRVATRDQPPRKEATQRKYEKREKERGKESVIATSHDIHRFRWLFNKLERDTSRR